MTTGAAIITAAGASTRMGRHKALLEWCGRTLVAHQVHSLREAGFSPVIVVTGAQADDVEAAVPEYATLVRNEAWRTGRSGSIEAGAKAVPDDAPAILVVAVDQPLEPDVVAALVPHAGDALVQPVDSTGRPGHPVLLGPDALEDLQRATHVTEGLRNVVASRRDHATYVEVDALPHWDLNTPESYQHAREMAASRD